MGTGYYGGFGKGPKKQDDDQGQVRLPADKSQLNHIFGERAGHLPDTPENRARLTRLAQDSSKYIGTDKYGNSWNVELSSDGKQYWVRYKNGVINEGGVNETPRIWDEKTGLNSNPFKRRRRRR